MKIVVNPNAINRIDNYKRDDKCSPRISFNSNNHPIIEDWSDSEDSLSSVSQSFNVDQSSSQSSREVRISDSEISNYHNIYAFKPLKDCNSVEFKEVVKAHKSSKSIERLNRIKRNRLLINISESCDAYDCEESKAYIANSSNITRFITDQDNSIKLFQYKSKQNNNFEKIINDFKKKLIDGVGTIYSAEINHSEY